MKYFNSLLIVVLTFSLSLAQSDFNEPPTRSEFEQVKSKIQIYERNQNSILSKMNAFHAEIDDAFFYLDSIMLVQELYIDSVVLRMALESQGIKEEAIAKFLTADDLDPIHEEIDTKLMTQDKKLMSMIDNLKLNIGILLILLILIIVFFLWRIRKLKKTLLSVQEENKTAMENNIASLQASLTKLEHTHRTDKEQINKNIEEHSSSIKSSTDLSIKLLHEKSIENMKAINENIETSIKMENAAWQKAIDAMKKSSDEKLKKSNDSMTEKLNEAESNLKSEIDKLSKIKDELIKDLKKIKSENKDK